MNTFKRKALFAAVVAALGAAGAGAAAQPPPQFAQPTVYPYYTVTDTSANASSSTLIHEYLAAVNARAKAAADFEAFFLGCRQHEGFIRWESNAGPASSALT